MTHLWVRAEERPNEERVGLTPRGAAELRAAGFRVTVEESRQRAIPLGAYLAAGCEAAPEGSWRAAPREAIIFGLKELPDDGSPLRHRHILFGHAFKGQPSGPALLERFVTGGGTLYDIEYLTNEAGRRVAAFGFWAGFAGAAVSVQGWVAQQRGTICPPAVKHGSEEALLASLRRDLAEIGRTPRVLIIGAAGRVGRGSEALCHALGLPTTLWGRSETASGGPFPEVLAHEIFLNCIFAQKGCPVFIDRADLGRARALGVIGDIACDPESDYNPIKVYDRITSWAAPCLRVADNPPLDVMAIDNLPSLLPVEASEDFGAQLLPTLKALHDIDSGIWAGAKAVFDDRVAGLLKGAA